MSNDQTPAADRGSELSDLLGRLVNEELAAYYEGEYMDHSVVKYRLQSFARAAVAAERERCAKLCEEMGALEALEGEDEGSAALVRVADRMADLCAAAIRKA